METSARYQNNVSFMKQLSTNSDRAKMQAPYSQNFETIYKEANQANVTLSNAKDFLKNLSKDALSTLQHYTGLADEINVDSLSNEGAYNLLMHDSEKYDFNGDGMVQDGIANKGSIIPTNMSDSMKASYVNALNSLGNESERFDAMTTVTLNYATVALEAKDGIVNPELSKPLTYEVLAARINSVLHPTQGAYASPELQETISKFWENFKSSYNNG